MVMTESGWQGQPKAKRSLSFDSSEPYMKHGSHTFDILEEKPLLDSPAVPKKLQRLASRFTLDAESNESTWTVYKHEVQR